MSNIEYETRKITQELLEKIIVDYKNGMTPKQISDKYT